MEGSNNRGTEFYEKIKNPSKKKTQMGLYIEKYASKFAKYLII